MGHLAKQDSFFYKNKTLNIKGELKEISTTWVMGILNITPDSFYDGGNYLTESQIEERAEFLIKEGAQIIDVGATSTRPGADTLSAEEEWVRLETCLGSIIELAHKNHRLVSLDTTHLENAKRAIDLGVDMINDVSAGKNNDLIALCGAEKIPYVLMHAQGSPQTMQNNPTYQNLTDELIQFFLKGIEKCHSVNCYDVIIDPGFGFGKTLQNNFEIFNLLSIFVQLFEQPVLIGLSRKSMIYKLLDVSPKDALVGTSVLHALAWLKGVDIIRTHDVGYAFQTIKLIEETKKWENFK